MFEYIHKKFRFVHTSTFCEYRKKLRASPRVHLVLYIESLLRFCLTFATCPSSVEIITLERGSNRSTISLLSHINRLRSRKLGDPCLKGVISRDSNCKLHINAIYDYLQIDLCARF